MKGRYSQVRNDQNRRYKRSDVEFYGPNPLCGILTRSRKSVQFGRFHLYRFVTNPSPDGRLRRATNGQVKLSLLF
jgi:hypothetical protein